MTLTTVVLVWVVLAAATALLFGRVARNGAYDDLLRHRLVADDRVLRAAGAATEEAMADAVDELSAGVERDRLAAERGADDDVVIVLDDVERAEGGQRRRA